MPGANVPLRRDAFNRVGESAFSPLPHQMMSDESIATLSHALGCVHTSRVLWYHSIS